MSDKYMMEHLAVFVIAALQDPAFTETVVIRAFTGRYARGPRNAGRSKL